MGKLYKALEKAEKERDKGQGLAVVNEDAADQAREPQDAAVSAPVSSRVPEGAGVPDAADRKPQPTRPASGSAPSTRSPSSTSSTWSRPRA